MRLAVTRPQADGERSAAKLRARGHHVLVAPLMVVEPIATDLAGDWAAVIVTSANAPGAIADRSRAMLIKLPVYAVGRRSAEAAKQTGFTDVTSAGGNVRDLVQLIAKCCADAKDPLLYLAGEDRAVDLIRELAAHGIAAAMRVVYRAVTMPFPPALIAALKAGEIDAVLHFSRRSAENYVSGAAAAGIAREALAPRQLCLTAQIAEPLKKAGAHGVAVAARSDESALLDLVTA